MCLARVWFPFNTNSLLHSAANLHCILQHRQHTKTSWFFAFNYSPHNASDTDTMCLRDALYAACNLLSLLLYLCCVVVHVTTLPMWLEGVSARLVSLFFLLSRAHITERRVENFDFDVEVKMLQAFCCRTSRRGNSNHCRLCFSFPFLELCFLCHNSFNRGRNWQSGRETSTFRFLHSHTRGPNKDEDKAEDGKGTLNGWRVILCRSFSHSHSSSIMCSFFDCIHLLCVFSTAFYLRPKESAAAAVCREWRRQQKEPNSMFSLGLKIFIFISSFLLLSLVLVCRCRVSTLLTYIRVRVHFFNELRVERL